MRRRLVLGTVAVIMVVLTALVPPVAILLRRAAERELQVRLSGQASAVSTAIADDLLQGTAPSVDQIARFVSPDDYLQIIDSDGSEVVHYGVPVPAPITGTADAPLGTQVRISAAGAALDRRVRGPLFALGAFALASIGLGALLATLVGRRLTRPLVELAKSADRLGSGDFTALLPERSGIPEIDRIGAALGTSAHLLDQMLTAERSFTGDATHQLRTGLAGLSLQLELLARHPDAEVQLTAGQALAQIDRQTQALDELLALARGGSEPQRVDVDIVAIASAHCDDWRARCRRAHRALQLTGVHPTVQATPGFIGQIIDILVDNALRHGTGDIVVRLHPRGLSVEDVGILDETQRARLFAEVAPADDPHGRGLILARRLARADGGSLELSHQAHTEFVLSYL